MAERMVHNGVGLLEISKILGYSAVFPIGQYCFSDLNRYAGVLTAYLTHSVM